jgi:dTDP-glucose pyrophosphorylase
MGYINKEQMRALAVPLGKSAYGQYLLRVIEERVL